MKIITEAYLIKLIKKYINKFMCCCVGSEVGEGEPEGLAREGAIYIDEEAPALYYFDGTEWVVLPGGDSAITEWTTAGRPATPYIGQHGYNTTLGTFEVWSGAYWMAFIKENLSQFADNAEALLALTPGQYYKTPDGDVKVVVSATTLPKIYTLILKTDLVGAGYDSLSDGNQLTSFAEILFNDFLGASLGLVVIRSEDLGYPTLRIELRSGTVIVDIHSIHSAVDSRYQLGDLRVHPSEDKMRYVTSYRSGDLDNIHETLSPIYTTIKFMIP